MAKKIGAEEFVKYFNKRESFTVNDVYRYYSKTSPNIKRATVIWRIYNLVKRGVLLRTGWGVYAVGKDKFFVPTLDKQQKNIALLLKKQFPLASYCCWRISFLMEFYRHLPAIDFIVVEAERDALDAVFHFLKDAKKDVFKEPSKEIIEDFISDKNNAVIVKPMISESPLLKINGISVSSLEKILVDIYAEKELFYFLQGSELLNIFKSAVDKYTIIYSKLFRYAKRRGKEEELRKIFKQINGND